MKRESGVASRCRIEPGPIRRRKPQPPAPPRRVTPGWLVVDAISDGEREVAFWLRYADRLTPDERKRMGGKVGDFSPLRRKLEPAMTAGQWLSVSPKLRVEIRQVVFTKGGEYRVDLGKIDDRRVLRAVHRRLREDPDLMTTIVPTNDWTVTPPEPERIPHSVVKDLEATRETRERYDRERSQERMDYETQPLAIRLARLCREAEEQGIDISSPERVIARQVAKIEERLRDRKLAA